MDKTVLITGATRGIGWALAEKAADMGYTVILNGRDTFKVKECVDVLRKKYPRAKVISCPFDVAKRTQVSGATKDINQIDILINNAGIIADSWWTNMDDVKWDSVIQTNLTGVYNVTKALTGKINAGGQIIMLTSKAALLGNQGQANYSAAKAGVIGLAQTLALELKHFDIRVNCVAPAAKTDMTKPAIEKIIQRLGALPDEWQTGSSEDVANFVIKYLLDIKTTGTIYTVNGKDIGYWSEPKLHRLKLNEE